ncbi:MAG: F0F1 ATP synthase subunit A [Candidatus Goldbacteria bacterium]|nr:F0F1 ATP synthase subunit A [Candidatus Goldiibacteriota bacterium]
MEINPDNMQLFGIGAIKINATIFYTWIVMALLTGFSAVITSRLSTGAKIPRWQGVLEVIVSFVSGQIRQVIGRDPWPYVPFLGTLGIFILVCNLMEVVPLYHPPTSSLSTTAALAVSVFFAVPFFGIMKNGLWAHIKSYFQPSFFMLPFHIISEVSRTVSLAVRLFGNIMSESLMIGVFLSVVPLFVPLVMQVFGLVIGVVQAYIFFTLATVYIGSSVSIHGE